MQPTLDQRNAMARLLRDGLQFHEAFNELWSRMDRPDSQKESYKKELASAMGTRSGISRRRKIVRQSTNVRRNEPPPIVWTQEELGLPSSHYPD